MMQTAVQGAGAFRSPQSFQSTALSRPCSQSPGLLSSAGGLCPAWRDSSPGPGEAYHPLEAALSPSSLSRHLSGAFFSTESLPWYPNSPIEAWILWTQNSHFDHDLTLTPGKLRPRPPQTPVEETQRPKVAHKALKKLNMVSLWG